MFTLLVNRRSVLLMSLTCFILMTAVGCATLSSSKKRINTIEDLVNRIELDKKQYHTPMGFTGTDTLKDLWIKKLDYKYYDIKENKYWGLTTSPGAFTPDIWICYSPDGQKWSPLYFVPVHFDNVRNNSLSIRKDGDRICIVNTIKGFLSRTKKDSIITYLDFIQDDRDSDGLTDEIEKDFGTDPRKADSDGDGIPDGKDLNPLTANQSYNDSTAIRQATFNWFIADWAYSPLPLYVTNEASGINQEFNNSLGYVLKREKCFEGRWNITKVTIEAINNNEAYVLINIHLLPGFASGWKLHLKNSDGKWLVDRSDLLWFS